MGHFKLSPSNFAFLWEECRRCFYLKVARGFLRPRLIMPKIFIVIDSRMNRCFDGARAQEIATGMPSGIVEYGQKWVQSEPIAVPGSSSTCFIRGRFDTVVKFDDGTYGVIDLKTSETKSAHIPLYGRQLHAYAYALEHPASGKLTLFPVTKLGLLYFYPDNINQQSIDRLNYGAEIVWIEVEKNEEDFLRFIDEVLDVLELPKAPKHSLNCQWCSYIKKLTTD